jgi:hypothetical protein
VNYSDIHDRVALIVMLESREHKNTFVTVACTHLYWDAKKVEDQLKELEELGNIFSSENLKSFVVTVITN